MTGAALRRCRRHRGQSGERGFTLIETLIATVITVVVLTFVYQIVGSSMKQSKAITDLAQQQADGRRALTDLVTSLREAWTDDDTKSRLQTATATTVSYYSPDRDTLTDVTGQAIAGASFHLRLITYQIVGTTLQRSILVSTNTSARAAGTAWAFPVSAAPLVTVLGNVQAGSTFAYRDKADALLTLPIASTGTIGAVDVTLMVDRTLNSGPDTDQFITTVELRGSGS